MTLVRIDGRYKVFWISTLCISDHARLGNLFFSRMRRFAVMMPCWRASIASHSAVESRSRKVRTAGVPTPEPASRA